MKSERKLLDNYIEKACMKISLNKQEREAIYDKLLEKRKLPVSISSDIITGRKGMGEFSDFVAFCILEKINNNEIKRYFTPDEIEYYNNSVFHVEEIKFPLILKDMVQITDDQWIGKISVKELIRLSQADLVNYNENTQRTMKRVVLGKQVVYRISINKLAVSEIRDSMLKGTYIPNTITLNIPEDAIFEYSNYTLKINEIKYFDILDGYHRFVAMNQAANMDENFDYEMELRIVVFPESKAKQFIFQEDQKTQMRKIDSASMNQNDCANLIAKKLNENPDSEIQGMLGRNDSKIPLAEFSQLINYYYVKDRDKHKNERVFVIETSNELMKKINYFMQSFPHLYDEKWTVKILCNAMYTFVNCNNLKEIKEMYLLIQEKTKEVSEATYNALMSSSRAKKIHDIISKML